MYAHVIPCLRLPRALGFFDYQIPSDFSNEVKVGSIVFISFRNLKIHGVVINISSKSNSPTRYVKPIEKVLSNIKFTKNQIELLLSFSETFFIAPATALVLVLNTLPRKDIEFKKSLLKFKKSKTSNGPYIKNDSLLLYNDIDIKEDYIYKLTKSYISNNKSVLLVSPEIRLVNQWQNKLKSFSPFIFHRQLPRLSFWNNYLNLQNNKVSLSIGTRTTMFMPFQNLGLIIIDDEDNSNHRQAEQNPRYHTAQAAELLQTTMKCNILYTSEIPRLTTYYKTIKKNLELIDLRKPIVPKNVSLTDLKQEKKLGNYLPFSVKLQNKIKNIIINNKKIFLFINKTGESSSLTCQDCGHVFTCPHCQKPYTIYLLNKNKQELVCHLCENRVEVKLICTKCHGTNLKKSGWGIQKIENDLNDLFKNTSIKTISSISSWQALKSRPTIGLGTKKVCVPEVLDKYDAIGIINADTILSLPDYSSAETTFRLICRMTNFFAKRDKDIIIQTFHPDNYAINLASKLSLEEFYTTELDNRKAFNYPPSMKIVKLMIKDKKEKLIEKEAEKLYHEINKADLPKSIEIIHPGPSYTYKVRNLYHWQMIIKYPEEHSSIVQNLIRLCNDKWLIDLNPDNLLS
ncbi:primosomal protein N' [Patescibacteria group bacterium]|nr:primosomal protein N' [Patescibacteria group bacterium]